MKTLKKKQKTDQEILKENIRWLFENIDSFICTDTRINYLMSVGVSCRKGTFSFEYGRDRVWEDSEKARIELKKSGKKMKKDSGTGGKYFAAKM